MRWLARRRVQLALFGGVALVSLVITTVLTLQVFSRLDTYGSTDTDNIQWTMAQLEVEQARLINAIDRLDTPDAEAIDAVRVRFDIFYSRLDTLRNGRTYRQVLAGTPADAQLKDIWQTLPRIAAIVDADASTVIANRDALRTAVAELTDEIRQLSSAGIGLYAARTDAERAGLTSALVRLTAISGLMLVAFLALLALLWQLYKVYRRRAFENRVTLNRLATILDTSQDAILVVDAAGRIRDVNGAARALFCLATASADGTRGDVGQILARRAADGTVAPVTGAQLFAACDAGPNRCTNLTALGRDGCMFPAELSANRTARGGEAVCVCFIRDISQRLDAEAEMQAARDRARAGERAKARFLGMISHEMRTPLNGLLGCLDLLGETRLTGEQRRYARLMQSSGQLLLGRIDDALQVARDDHDRLSLTETDFDLGTVVSGVIEEQRPAAEERGNRIALLTPNASVGPVRGDRDRLQQILLNLLSNAVKFTQDGEITIEVQRLGPPDAPDDRVEIRIGDTGVGIRRDELDRIFDDYVRLGEAAQAQGSGLGLGIVRHLTELMDGEIGAESEPGEGSLFWVRLPLPAAGAAVAGTPAGPVAAEGGAPMDVLIVEDNAANRFVLEEMLHKDGHRVTVTADGTAGVARAAAQSFDVILMDISMPGLDGADAARRIRASGGASAHARIVAMTAHFRPEEIRASDFDAVQAKPVRLCGLRAVLAGQRPDDPVVESGGPVDFGVLDQLRTAGAADGFSLRLAQFIEEGEALVQTLRNVGAAADPEMARRLHDLAGSAAVFGALALRDALARAEAALTKDTTAEVRAALMRVPPVWAATRAELEACRHAA
ncbi:ATP-binding protein [Roseovarius salinarum]|uniref:ATP-binding protein n=1 Tax=Roseovarius salinarum TaxID=1981892 RepID=UPI000C32B335|nr:ATP-binding protein [Roseovarius salinarum]